MLVPVDFSETSKRALQSAVDLAEALKTESITVLHVAMRPTDYLPLDDWIFGKHQPPKDVESKVMKSAQRSLDQLLERHDAAPVDLAARVEFGPASATILEVAKQDAMDLVVIGTRGRNAPRLQKMAGSTVQRVVRASVCPVLCIG
jgi:nucleotide-binding universal stress UspA family protein